MHSTNKIQSSTQNQVTLEPSNFDLWAKVVKQQMLEALQHPSESTDNDDFEDLDTLDDELE
ncbi:MAG: hypothetical protein WBA13_11045 [Microcoleaceae cyanobacterium]